MGKFQKLLVAFFIIFFTYMISSNRACTAQPSNVLITFTQSGVGNDTSETILRIDGVDYQFSELPLTFIWISSSQHRVAVADHIMVIPGEKQYKFTGWINGVGLSGDFYLVPAADTVVTANYNTEYIMSLHVRTIQPSSVLPPSNVYIGGNLIGNVSEAIPISVWVNDTYSGTIGVDDLVSGGNGTRYAFLKWDNDNSTQNPRSLELHAASNFMAVYIPQYQVTFINQTVEGSITPNETAYYNLESHILMSAVPNSGYAFSKWTSVGAISFYNRTSSSSIAVINGSGSIEAQFTDTVLISFAASGMLSDASGTTLIIDSTNYTYSQLPIVLSWKPDSSHNVTAPLLVSSYPGKRYLFLYWNSNGQLSGNNYTVPASNRTVTARYATQYLLTVINGNHGITSGQGWNTNGTFAVFSITPTLETEGSAIQHVFNGWSSVDNGGYTGTNSTYGIIVYNTITETAQWITQPVKLPPEWMDLIYIANYGIAIFGAILFIKWIINTRR